MIKYLTPPLIPPLVATLDTIFCCDRPSYISFISEEWQELVLYSVVYYAIILFVFYLCFKALEKYRDHFAVNGNFKLIGLISLGYAFVRMASIWFIAYPYILTSSEAGRQLIISLVIGCLVSISYLYLSRITNQSSSQPSAAGTPQSCTPN